MNLSGIEPTPQFSPEFNFSNVFSQWEHMCPVLKLSHLDFLNLGLYKNDFREKLPKLIYSQIQLKIEQINEFFYFFKFLLDQMEFIKINLASNKSSPPLTVACVLSYRGRFEKILLIKSHHLFEFILSKSIDFGIEQSHYFKNTYI